jgi:fructokinase
MKFPNKNILCIGEVLWDVLADSGKPGGAPLNVALHLARLGSNVNIFSKVGNDAKGRELVNIIRNGGLNTSHIQIDENLPTSEVLVMLDKKGNASFEIKEPVAWDILLYTPDLKELSKNAGVIVYGTLASRNRPSRETIIKSLNSEAVKIIDVNLRPPFTDVSVVKELLNLADIAKLNQDELRIIAGWDEKSTDNDGGLMQWISQKYRLKMVCVTRGENGAIMYAGNSFYEHPGYKVEVGDTVGAGDAFLAGLISFLLNGDSMEHSLEFACATGAFVASQPGATPAYRLEDIRSILNNPI